MSKKQIRILFPLGLLLAGLIVLTGCRPSTALTQLMEALNALNPGTEETMTEEEQEEQETSSQTDPMDEERDDAKIEEMDILIGQLLENMDEEEAREALEALYSAATENHDWGAQEYDPDRVTDLGNESSALALYIRGGVSRNESALAAGMSGALTDGTGSVKREGVASSDGTLESENVTITPDADSGGDGKGGGSDGNVPGYSEGGGTDPDPGSGGESGGTGAGVHTGQNDFNESDGSSDGESDSDEEWEEIDYGHYIAATGDAAIMVCMLGCSDRLVATSWDFHENALAQRAWNSDNSMDYKVLWNDDGSTSLDETDFKYLMEDVHPDVCIEVSGSNTFTEDQIIRMQQEYKIGYFCIPAMTTEESCTEALGRLATSLKKGEPEEAQQKIDDIVDNYEKWVNEELLSLAKNTKDFQQTVFIEDWDDTAETQFRVMENDTLPIETTGAAVIRVGWSFRPLNEYLLRANVCDWAVSPHVWSDYTDLNSGYGHGGNSGVATYPGYRWWENDGIRWYSTQAGDLCYVSPVFNLLQGTYGTSNEAYSESGLFYSGGRTGVAEIDGRGVYDDGTIMESYNPYGLSFGFIHPGYSNWGTVVAKTQTIAGKLEGDPLWQKTDGSARMLFLEDVTYGHNGNTDVYGIRHSLNETSGYLTDMSYYTTVEGDYTILTNPSGMMSWSEGSPESILESIWACWKISGYYREDRVESRIRNFYSTFYGLNLTDEEYENILAGPV